MINENNVTWLEGYLMAISVLERTDTQESSLSAILCELDDSDLLDSFVEFWNKQLSDDEIASTDVKLEFGEIKEIYDWQKWMKSFLKNSILNHVSINLLNEKKDYMIWNIIESVVGIVEEKTH